MAQYKERAANAALLPKRLLEFGVVLRVLLHIPQL
jgi:hypothetical protein